MAPAAHDPLMFATAAAVFLAVSAVASDLPTRSAANSDPLTALRVD